MAHELKMTNLIVDPDSGAVEVQYEWNGVADSATFGDMNQLIGQYTDPIQNFSEALRYLLAYWLAFDPTGSTPALVEGKLLTIDFAATPQFVLGP